MIKNKNTLLPKIIINKKINKEKDNKNELRMATIITVVFIILALLFSGYALAKVVEEKILNINAQIANPILVVENGQSIDITETNSKGVYNFYVKNYNENNVRTDTDLRYFIKISENVDNGIELKLYENGIEIPMQNGQTEYIYMSKDKNEKKDYKIEIIYNKDKSTTVDDIMQQIQVKVHTEQVKG